MLIFFNLLIRKCTSQVSRKHHTLLDKRFSTNKIIEKHLLLVKKRTFAVKLLGMELINKSFRDCTLTFMDKTFKMRQIQEVAPMKDWLNIPNEISDFERESLLFYQEGLAFNVYSWNEHELKKHFIGPIFTLVDFSSYEFNHFSQREVSGQVDNYFLSGKPDGMVASGRREPEQPYFAFQEYKKELDPNGDPAGQALAAMLVGQMMEEKPQVMYGCYVVGSIWKFIALGTDRKYSLSTDYSALDDDIFDIFRILKNLKNIVVERTSVA